MDSDASGAFSESRIRAIRTPDYTQHYGHTYMATVARAGKYNSMTTDTLLEHLREAGPGYEALPHEFKSVLVDEERREVAVRWEIKMKVKGSNEVIDYDICWLVQCTEDGEKARSATEFIDGFARDRVAELLEGAEEAS